jgi:flagellar biosynthesis regulator FlaF
MTDKNEQTADMLSIFKNIYADEIKREDSIHHSASSLLIASGCLLGLSAVSVCILLASQDICLSLADQILLLGTVGTVFASLLVAVLAQWHQGRDQIASADAILMQIEEAPESFAEKEQRVQYEYELYQKICSDLQHSNRVLNHRLRAAGITFASGAGIFVIALCLILFGI